MAFTLHSHTWASVLVFLTAAAEVVYILLARSLLEGDVAHFWESEGLPTVIKRVRFGKQLASGRSFHVDGVFCECDACSSSGTPWN